MIIALAYAVEHFFELVEFKTSLIIFKFYLLVIKKLNFEKFLIQRNKLKFGLKLLLKTFNITCTILILLQINALKSTTTQAKINQMLLKYPQINRDATCIELIMIHI